MRSVDHPSIADSADRPAMHGLRGEDARSGRASEVPSASMVVGAAMSYLAQSCPHCGGLYIWDDDLGRFHEATGEEPCPTPESLEERRSGELEEVTYPAPLGRSHVELKDLVAVAPGDFPGFAAGRDSAPDGVAGEED